MLINSILSIQNDIHNNLLKNNIELHLNNKLNIDSRTVDYLAVFVYFEQLRRSNENKIVKDLLEFEKSYLGIEVGNLRRYFNRLLLKNLDFSNHLLDFGCGGSWFKDVYWPKFTKVTGVEVNPYALFDLRNNFPDWKKYQLVYTNTGLTNFESETFSQILSSSVIGYILPKQAEYHLFECWRLLKPGGILIITRIKLARGILNTNHLRESTLGSFEYAYSKKELIELLDKTCSGYSVVKYMKMGILPPKIPIKIIQKDYSYKLIEVLDKFLTKILPFWAIHHFIIVRKK